MKMVYVISDDCIVCGICIDECLVEVIFEGDKYFINLDLCIECGICVDVCFFEVIYFG